MRGYAVVIYWKADAGNFDRVIGGFDTPEAALDYMDHMQLEPGQLFSIVNQYHLEDTQ